MDDGFSLICPCQKLKEKKNKKNRGRVYYIFPVGVNNATTLIITKCKIDANLITAL